MLSRDSHDVLKLLLTLTRFDSSWKRNIFWCNEDSRIIDITNKSNPTVLSTFNYSNTAYTHQGWLTADQKYWMPGDTRDEQEFGLQPEQVVDLTNLRPTGFKS
jgi:hypothetical protein